MRFFTMLALWQFTCDRTVRCVVVASARVLAAMDQSGIHEAVCAAAFSLVIKGVGSLIAVTAMHPRHAYHTGRS